MPPCLVVARCHDERPTALESLASIEHVRIEMPDGIRLSARQWMPALPPPGGVPALFEYIPYRKADMVRAR